MTARCPGGGPSQIKPGTSNTVIFSSALITGGLAVISPWLIPFAALIDTFNFEALGQCTTDPPPMPTTAQLDPINAIGGVLNSGFSTWLTAVHNVLLNWAWDQYCQCASGTAAPVTYPSAPATSSTPSGTSYQSLLLSKSPAAAFALTEAAGADFAPYVGGSHLTGTGTFGYRLPDPTGQGFAVEMELGSRLSLNFVAQVFPPDTVELWVRFPTFPLSSNPWIFYNGTASTNGTGLYVNSSNSHLHYFQGGGVDYDTLYVWPDSGWHLVSGGAGSGNVITIAVDGKVIWQQSTANPKSPSPNALYIGSTADITCQAVMQFAWPAFFAKLLTPDEIARDYLPSTATSGSGNPTTTGNVCTPDTATLNLLNAIWQAVQQMYTSLPRQLDSYAESAVHAGLSGSGSFAIGPRCIGVKVTITTDAPYLGMEVGTPTYLPGRGFIVPLAVEGPISRRNALVYNPQLFTLPALTDAIGYTLAGGVVVTITELVAGP